MMDIALNQELNRTQLIFILISLLLGFVIINQIRSQANLQELYDLSEQEMSLIIRELSVETNSLRDEYVELRIRLSDYERKEADKGELLNKAAQDLQTLKIIAGIVQVDGPGVKLIVHDKEQSLQAYDFLEIIHELKSAGAEAITVNKKRLDAKSYFYIKNGYIFLNNEKVEPPYEIEAIGDTETLYQSLNLPGGVIDTLSSLPEVTVDVSRDAFLLLPIADEQEEQKKLE